MTIRKARQWLIEDLKVASTQVAIVTEEGRDEFFVHPEISKALRQAWQKGVEIIFIVHPKFQVSLLRELVSDKVIQLRRLIENPCAGLRLIDGNGTYTTEFSPHRLILKNFWEKIFPDDRREYLRTWNHKGMAEKQQELIKKYFVLSSPVQESDLES